MFGRGRSAEALETLNRAPQSRDALAAVSRACLLLDQNLPDQAEQALKQIAEKVTGDMPPPGLDRSSKITFDDGADSDYNCPHLGVKDWSSENAEAQTWKERSGNLSPRYPEKLEHLTGR